MERDVDEQGPVVGVGQVEEAGGAGGEVGGEQHVVDLRAEGGGGAGRPAGGAVVAGEPGGVAQAGVEDAAEGGVVLGGVEVPGEDEGRAAARAVLSAFGVPGVPGVPGALGVIGCGDPGADS